jgi:hypothetical protein
MDSCLQISIEKVDKSFYDSINITLERIPYASVTNAMKPLNLTCSLVCSANEILWLPLYSSDGYALVDVNGLILLAK